MDVSFLTSSMLTRRRSSRVFFTIARPGEDGGRRADGCPRDVCYNAESGGASVRHRHGDARYEDGQVEDSDPTQSGNYQQQQSYTQTAPQQPYTQTDDGTQQQQHWVVGEQHPEGEEE